MLGFEMVAGGHNFHALLEIDITNLRKHLREKRIEGSGGSLFSLMLKAIGKCLQEFPELNAMADPRHTTYFDEVDINIPIEVNKGGELYNKQLTIRNINGKTLKQVDEEIHNAKNAEDGKIGFVETKLGRRILGILPNALVLFFFRMLLRDHETIRKYSGTIFVTSVSMFSNIPGYVIPYAGGPKAVSFALGSTNKKPVVIGNEIVIREIINITATFNHDLVDGAPAARFMNRFRNLLEKSYGEL
jgi:pyruvate/2-oxoglutarate dehydrogenase complex dihydrolipoamide acyltransferase (E2) component